MTFVDYFIITIEINRIEFEVMVVNVFIVLILITTQI